MKAYLNKINGLLKSRGYLFLNEVYQELGFPLTQQETKLGWTYREEDDKNESISE